MSLKMYQLGQQSAFGEIWFESEVYLQQYNKSVAPTCDILLTLKYYVI